MNDAIRRIVVGISGASGVIYGFELLKALKRLDYETHLIMTEAARKNFLLETKVSIEEVESCAGVVHRNQDLAAAVSSGSFLTMGMAVIPCTIKTLSAVAHSYNENLIVRAADVTLKERRPLVLVVRETPLHQGHLELMLKAARNGATILPPLPAFYHGPQTIEDIIAQTIGKVLDCFHIPHRLFQRWGENR